MPFNTQGYGNLFGGIPANLETPAESDISYIRSTPTPYAVGGAPAGSVFNGTIIDALDKILYPAVAPQITLKSDIPTTNRQLGLDTISTVTLTATVTKKTSPISKIEFFQGATLLESQPYVAGQNTYTYEVTTPIKDTVSFTAKVTDTKGKSTTSTAIKYNFYYPNFSCVSTNAIADITMQEIIDNGTMRLEDKANKTIPFTGTMARYIFCYPASWGTRLSSILDSNNYEYINAFQKKELTYTSGTTQVPMIAYISKEPCNLDNFKYTFKF